MSTYTADEIAKWFLSQKEMSPKKLQKMLYYAYSWVLTLTNDSEKNLSNRLFEERFEAWVHGPVIRRVYDTYKDYGYSDIPKYEGELPDIDEDVLDILNQVMEVYGDYNGNQLEIITHQEEPWKEARDGYEPLQSCDVEILDQTIYSTYIKRVI